ncbi:MAG: YbaB/EbfC family nucleoid-associated protein [Pseudomonadota bacterium]|nr:YbaB/EbfC family nucleoid-associated protein [Pseudomonadota bacterium]
MKDIGELLRQAQQMKKTMKQAQKELDSTEVLGESGGGMTRVHMTCKYKVKRVEIDDELLREKKQTIESVVAAAYNDAAKKVERKVQEKYSGIAGGLPLPQGMKLPF